MQRFTSTMSPTGALDPGGIPEGFKYATLGPNSLIDRVRVGSIELGPGTVIDIEDRKLTRVRPMPQTAALAAAPIDGLLELELWTCDESPVPRRRNAYSIEAVHTVYSHATDYTMLARLPVAGRRAASIHMLGTAGKPFQWACVAVKYGSPSAGTGRDSYFIIAPVATVTPATTAATITGSGANVLAEVQLYGGLDNHEDFDELQLWYNNVDADAFDLRMEAYDLCP